MTLLVNPTVPEGQVWVPTWEAAMDLRLQKDTQSLLAEAVEALTIRVAEAKARAEAAEAKARYWEERRDYWHDAFRELQERELHALIGDVPRPIDNVGPCSHPMVAIKSKREKVCYLCESVWLDDGRGWRVPT